MAFQIVVTSDLFEIPGEEGTGVAERFFVAITTPKGRVFRHVVSFPSVELAHDVEEGPYYRRVWNAVDKAEALAERIRAHVVSGGKLGAAYWEESAPIYGSEAYIEFEANEIAPALAFVRDGGSLDDVSHSVRAYL